MGSNRKLKGPQVTGYTWLVSAALLLLVAWLRFLYYTALLIEPLDKLIVGAWK